MHGSVEFDRGSDGEAYKIIYAAYAAWSDGDLAKFGSYFAPDVVFEVSSAARTYVGSGDQRDVLLARLDAFLTDYEVLYFDVTSASPLGDEYDFRVTYVYKSRAPAGLDIDGVQRHLWRVEHGAITSFTIVHDTQRLGAYFELNRMDLV